MYRFYPIVLVFIISSCGLHLNYLGKTSAPTENVDVFVDAGAIKKRYTIVGRGYIEGMTLSRRGYDKMQRKALKMAKEKGADAILFQDFYYTEAGTATYQITQRDTVGSGMISIPGNSISPVVSSRTDILFLKYE